MNCRIYFLLLVLSISILCLGENVDGCCMDLLVGQTVHVTSFRHAYKKYNLKNNTLKGEFSSYDNKQYINKDYVVSIVSEPEIWMYKNKQVNSSPEVLYKFASEDGDEFYYTDKYRSYLSIEDMPECECRFQKNIRVKEDKFNKTSVRYYRISDLCYPLDQIIVLDADSFYTVTLILTYLNKPSSTDGIYFLFEDDDVFKDKSAEAKLEYKGYDYKFSLTATLILDKNTFKKFANCKIKSVRVGSVERDLKEDAQRQIIGTTKLLVNKE